MSKFLKKYIFIILALVIAVGGYFYVMTVGKDYVFVEKNFSQASEITDVTIDEEFIGMAEVLDWEVTGNVLKVNLRSVKPGRFFVCNSMNASCFHRAYTI